VFYTKFRHPPVFGLTVHFTLRSSANKYWN